MRFAYSRHMCSNNIKLWQVYLWIPDISKAISFEYYRRVFKGFQEISGKSASGERESGWDSLWGKYECALPSDYLNASGFRIKTFSTLAMYQEWDKNYYYKLLNRKICLFKFVWALNFLIIYQIDKRNATFTDFPLLAPHKSSP